MSQEYIAWKVDYYMNHYIMSQFEAENIHWYFSLSGGKDSFVLADSIYNWYKKNNKRITATGLHILQWDDSKSEIETRFGWLDDLLFLDARKETSQFYKSNSAKQILCSDCSQIRKTCSDTFFVNKSTSKSKLTNILCRGLHLTDMANSMLWRLLWEKDPINSILEQKKGKPLVKLFSDLYLAKPLCLAREYECQNYADLSNYKAYQCDCPALIYPGRRDVIEESVSLFYTDLLWEFNIPGMDLFFSNILQCNKELILNHSMPGKEDKRPTLPEAFFEFAVDYFYKITQSNRSTFLSYISDFNSYIEDYMPNFLLHNQSQNMVKRNINFKLLSAPEKLTQFDKRMISTLGPLWGALSLDLPSKMQVLQMQEDIYKFHLEATWGQVINLLNLYYTK